MHTHASGRFSRIGHLLVDLCIVVVALAHIGPLAGAIDGTAAPSAAVATPRVERVSTSRVCFPASKWDANDALRPCAKITRVYEDGSVQIAVSDANGTVRYTTGIGALDR